MINTDDRLLRREEVETRCGIPRSTIYRLMRLGEFPEPVKVGQRAVRWIESEITGWQKSRPRAKGEADDELTDDEPTEPSPS